MSVGSSCALIFPKPTVTIFHTPFWPSLGSGSPAMNPRSFLTTLLSRVRLARREEAARAEETLRGSEERFSRVFHACPLAMAITRVRDGRLVDANESFLELFGYARDQVIGRTTLELGLYVEPKERARAAAVVRE